MLEVIQALEKKHLKKKMHIAHDDIHHEQYAFFFSKCFPYILGHFF